MGEHKDIDIIYQTTAGVEANDLQEGQKALKDYLDFVWKIANLPPSYNHPESSILLPLDDNFKSSLLEKIKQRKNPELKYIVVVGIGGSNLGTMALYQALRGLDVFMHQDAARIIFLDTVSPTLILGAINFINDKVKAPEELLINVISKSGDTTETVANYEVIYDALKKKFGDKINERFVFTTDRDSKLWQAAQAKNLDVVEIPAVVGGRYSVFSAVSMFPLGLSGFDINGFWEGAGEMSKRCTQLDVYQNPALASAILTYVNYTRGFNIYNSFYFNPELKSLGRWYNQLMAESIGKEFNLNNEKVNIGITPIISLGSVDLHSMATLFLGEPKNKFTQFIHAAERDNMTAVPKELSLPGLVDDISGKSLADIMGAIFYGVKIAYLKNGLPYSEIVMHDISEHTLGQYLQLKMCETMYLARLFGVNAFDQPKVEDYKRETREILKKL
jgi:glucose-6-phosphate isomerase